MVGTHKWLYAHYIHPGVILDQFVNVPIFDGWNAQMTLCSLHPPRRHIESDQRSYNWWLERINDSLSTLLNQFINFLIDGWNAQMTLCSLHPPRRHIESVYQRSYNWWLERTNDSMLITPTQTSYWISLSTFLFDGWNAQMTLITPIQMGWNAQMTLCSLHPPRRHIESVYQRSYNWWLERTNDSMLITPTQTSYWISLSTFL